MPPFSRSRILSLALAAFLCVCAPAENFAKSQIEVETIQGLQLSGYNSDDLLKWTIEAEEASLEPGSESPGTDALKTGQWNVRQLKVKTYSGKSISKNAKDVTVESTRAKFFPETRFAESDAEVFVKKVDNQLAVEGKGWSWKCDEKSDFNRIEVKKNVVVTLRPKAENKTKNDAETIVVTSDSLEIELYDERTVLIFKRKPSDPIKVKQSGIETICDKLEIVLPASAKQMDEDAQSAGDDKLQKLERISGSGNVKLVSDGKEVSGDFVEFIPAEERFIVSGNAHFSDPENDIKITGKNATGQTRQVDKKLRLETIEIDSAPQKRVSVEMKSLEKENPKFKNARARFWGEKLSVAFLENDENIIRLEKNVTYKDATISMTCDELEVHSRRLKSENLPELSDKKQKAEILKVVADGNVKAEQEGRILKCGKAEIFPQEERIELTRNPNVAVPAENFALAGMRCEIFRKERNINVYGDEKTRVTTTFSGKPKSGKRAENTTLVGNFLKIYPDDLNPKFTVFELDGNVEIASPERSLEGTCDKLFVWSDTEEARKNRNRNRGSIDALKKIEAHGNVFLKKDETEIRGGKAQLFTQVKTEEWLEEDDDGSDGKKPTKIVVFPDEANPVATRPVITLPQNAASAAFTLPLPRSKQSASEKNTGTQKITIAGDELETLFGERRVRFWLKTKPVDAKENEEKPPRILLKTETATCECYELEAELRRNDTNAQFEPQAVFCRENVRITHGDATATGNLLEIFPPKKIGALSGNASMTSATFGTTTPGESAGDRFILDLEKQEVRIETLPEVLREAPAQVARPRTLLPKGITERFRDKVSDK